MREANAAGWRSRSACKLLEIDVRHKFLAQAKAVVDLGAAPGGWCQVALSRVRADIPVIGVDLLDCKPLAGVVFLQGDLADPKMAASVTQHLAGAADVLLCDASPNLSGIKMRDDASCERLHAAVFDFVDSCGASVLVLKSFAGNALEKARQEARARFKTVSLMRLKATRKQSREGYIVAKTALGR